MAEHAWVVTVHTHPLTKVTTVRWWPDLDHAEARTKPIATVTAETVSVAGVVSNDAGLESLHDLVREAGRAHVLLRTRGGIRPLATHVRDDYGHLIPLSFLGDADLVSTSSGTTAPEGHA